MRRLTTLFLSEFLEGHAEFLGVVERDRKLQIPAFVWAFVFGFAAGESRTLTEFRRSYNATADETISPGRFYQRLTPSLAEYLRDLVEVALDGSLSRIQLMQISTGSASLTKKHTTARSLTRVRGSKTGWYCSIKRISSTVVSH